MSTRAPIRFATYPGDVTGIVGEIKGPNLWGEYLTALEAVHDPVADRTRVGFAFTTTQDHTGVEL